VGAGGPTVSRDLRCYLPKFGLVLLTLATAGTARHERVDFFVCEVYHCKVFAARGDPAGAG
jgi:hypothetical protein